MGVFIFFRRFGGQGILEADVFNMHDGSRDTFVL